MHADDVDWAGLLLVFAILGWLAYGFSRRTYRVSVLLLAAASTILVTSYGLEQRGRPPANYGAAFRLGGGRLAQTMLAPVLPGAHRSMPGLAGWIALLVLLGSVLVCFDTVCARREQPRVQPSQIPAGKDAQVRRPHLVTGTADPEGQAAITEELQFRLPAVEVRKPAAMPGGSTLENLAAVVSDSGVQGSRATAALMRAVHALEARPRAYEARLLVERCDVSGEVQPAGTMLRVTVDVRDIRNGQSIVVKMLPPCPPDEAAERVAGFTARQVFRRDVATPAWAVGSADGEDLSAYLLAREKCPPGRTFRDRYECRQRQRGLLERAVAQSSNAGLVQYDLAGLCDLDGASLESLLLHLDNRVHHPRFLRGRYRLAMSFSMMSTPALFEQEWRDAGGLPASTPAARSYRDRAAMKHDIIRALRRSGMLGVLSSRERADLLDEGHIAGGARTQADRAKAGGARAQAGGCEATRAALLRLARAEFAAYRKSVRVRGLLLSAFLHRGERASLLEMLRAQPRWWQHQRRRLWAPSLALEIVDQRLSQLLDEPAVADAKLAAAQAKSRHLLGLDGMLDQGQAWVYGKTPWQAVYNAACLHALPRSRSRPPGREAADTAVLLLRLAIGDQACELGLPSEWIATDPDLRSLREHPAFIQFVREQGSRDFAAAKHNDVGDPWFGEQLPRKAADPAPGAPTADPHPAGALAAETPPDDVPPVPPVPVPRIASPRLRTPAGRGRPGEAPPTGVPPVGAGSARHPRS